MTKYIIIILNANKQYKHALRNQNGLASIKFGSVASFSTLSLLKRNFPEGLGGCLSYCGKSGGMGGYSLPQKTENPGRRGS